MPGDDDIISRRTLLNWRINVAGPPCWKMKSFEDKNNPIESVASDRLGFLHKHNAGCGMTLMLRIQGARKGGRYRISIVIR